MKRKESFFRATDIFRIGLVLLLVSFLSLPFISWYKEEKEIAEFHKREAAYKEQIQKEYAEWQFKSDDEKFIWMIKDMDKDDAIKDVVVNESENAIYIRVLGLPINMMTEDAWAGYIEYETYMSSFALSNDIEKDIYVVGMSKDGAEYWRINWRGDIVDTKNNDLINL